MTLTSPCASAKRGIALALAALALASSAANGQSPDQLARLRARRSPVALDTATTAFTHVRVLPMDTEQPRALDDQTVIVRNGRIAAISAAASTPAPRGARIIDGTGLTLLPGLADLHIHLRYLNNAADNPRLLELLLANGVTTTMNMLGLPEHLALRGVIDSGRVSGPVLYTSGFYMNEPYVRTPEQVDSAVRAQRAAGYDVLKVHGELSAPAQAALFTAARREGMPVVGHLVRQLGLRAALDEHQYLIAHAEEYVYGWIGFKRTSAIPDDSVRPLINEAARLTAAAGTWVSPTLVVFQHIVPQMTSIDSVLESPPMKALPASLQAEWRTANPYTNRTRFPLSNVDGLKGQAQFLSVQTLALHRAGVRLVLGTDAGVPGTSYGFSVHEELAALVGAGLTPYEALRTATANAATFLAAEHEFGTVAVGRRADLLLVRGDPLGDVGVLRNAEGLMVRGKWILRAALDRMISH